MSPWLGFEILLYAESSEQGLSCLSDADPECVGDHIVHCPQQRVPAVPDEHNIQVAVPPQHSTGRVT